MWSIQIDKLVKQYKNGVRALDDLCLNVKNGEIFSLLGPNGAGKTSLINVLTTFYKPTSGKVMMLEKDLCSNPAFIRTQIACVAQHVSIDEHLSLMENMVFQSRLYKVDRVASKERIKSLIDSFGLSRYLKYPVSSYSGGIKRRLDIAMNMVSYPKILFLDEPTVGMDVESRKAMWKTIRNIQSDFRTTIFLTTHNLEEADQLSDTICIIKNGHTLAQGTPSELRNYIRQNVLRIGFSDPADILKNIDALDKVGLVKSTRVLDNSLFISVEDSKKAFPVLNRWLLDNNAFFNSIEIAEPELEDVFLALTGMENIKIEDHIC